MTVLAYRDSEPESRDFWKHELTQAVSEIRRMYDDKLELMRADMESSCAVKVIGISVAVGELILLRLKLHWFDSF